MQLKLPGVVGKCTPHGFSLGEQVILIHINVYTYMYKHIFHTYIM